MAYQKRDFYSPEASAQIDTLNAVEAQMRLKYARNVEFMTGKPPSEDPVEFWATPDDRYLQGMRDALANLTHVNGTIAGLLANSERRRVREAEVVHAATKGAHPRPLCGATSIRHTDVVGDVTCHACIEARGRNDG